jgi:hypothetical protein
MSCNCSKPAGSYEWVYSNFGNSYSIVGHDYGGQNTSILNKLPFVRQKGSNTCDSNSWVLNLGYRVIRRHWHLATSKSRSYASFHRVH